MGDCTQRKLKMLYHVPPTRFNALAQSPYVNTENTQQELDMRRKAEILKYNGSQKGNFVNSTTRTQRFSQIARGFSPNQRAQAIQTRCETIPTLSTRSGVPGPAMLLQLRPEVPLYNYATNNRAYAEQVNEDETPWRFYVNALPAALDSGTTYTIGTLEIFRRIPNARTSYTLTVPYDGDNTGTALLQVTYGGSVVQPLHTATQFTNQNVVFTNIDLITNAGYFYELQLTVTTSDGKSLVLKSNGITLA